MKYELAPFIYKFSYGGSNYVYDVNTDQIVEVEKPVYEIIENVNGDSKELIYSKFYSKYEIPALDIAISKIREAKKEEGLFSSFRPKRILFGISSRDDIIDYQKTYGLKQLILEITRRCNLRCSYCNVSGKYAEKVTRRKNMSKSLLRRSIDYFFDQNVCKEPSMSFYGGEPLLRFGLIKDAVDYIKKKHDANPRYNITTNGTLINEEIIDFLAENDFSTFVSLDGPEQVNDRYRVFKNNRGTFKTIVSRLEFIKKRHPNYFKNRIAITNVLAPPFHNLNEIIRFYQNNQSIKNKIKPIFVDSRGTTFYEDFGIDNPTDTYEKIMEVFIERIKNAILKQDLLALTIEMTSEFHTLARMIKIVNKKLYDIMYPHGACHIGMHKLYVNLRGRFFICEKSGNESYEIGDIQNGLDYDKIASLYKKLEELSESCLDCWAIHYCERCWAQIGNLDQFTGERKTKFCSLKKKIVERAFKMYVDLIRQKPDFYRVFGDYQI